MSRQRKRPMSSLDWSRKFEVLSISRLSISSLGFQIEDVKALTDADMEAIADSLEQGLHSTFTVAFHLVVRQYMAKRGSDKRTGGDNGEEPIR